MEGIMIALSILIGCIFIGIELRKGLGENFHSESENESESEPKYKRYKEITVLGENYSSVAAVIDKFKEYNPTKNVVYDRVKDGTIDEYINTLIEKKKAEETKIKEPEKEQKKHKIYITNKMPAKLLIKYNLKAGDWVQDILTMMMRTGLSQAQIYYWKRSGYLEIR